MNDRNRPTVLVTGGAGYIGSHAVLALRDAGWTAIVIDDLSTGFRFAVPDDVPFYEGDIENTELVQSILSQHRVGAIMHFAGSIIVPESVEDPLKYYGNNTVNTHAIVRAALAEGVRHFIFSSTAATYGNPQQTPITEEAQTRPINPYGWSKLMTEQLLADTARAHPFNFCALRYFNVAGADPNARSGQATEKATHLIKVAVEAATGKRNGVSIFGTDFETPDGTGVRDYIHVSDLAEAHLLALEALIEEPETSLVMNCGYGTGFSVREVLDAVDRVTNRKIERLIEPRRAGDPAILVSDPSRLRARLSWKPSYQNLDIIIEHALQWERRLSDIRGSDATT